MTDLPDTRTTENPEPLYDGPVCSRCGHEPHDDRTDPRCGEIVGGWDQPMPTPDYCGCVDVDALYGRLVRAEAAQGAAPRAEGLDRWEPAVYAEWSLAESLADAGQDPRAAAAVLAYLETVRGVTIAVNTTERDRILARLAPQEHRDKEACCLDCLGVDEAGTETGACEHPGCSCHAGVKQ